MGSCPGGVAHDVVDSKAALGVEHCEEFPVEAFELGAERGGGGEGAEHVGADGGVVDVGACGDIEEELCEGEGEGVAHGVDEDVRDEEGEGVPGENEGAEGLPDECEVGPCRGSDPVAGGEEEEEDAGGVEVDVEAVLRAVSGGVRVYVCI